MVERFILCFLTVCPRCRHNVLGVYIEDVWRMVYDILSLTLDLTWRERNNIQSANIHQHENSWRQPSSLEIENTFLWVTLALGPTIDNHIFFFLFTKSFIPLNNSFYRKNVYLMLQWFSMIWIILATIYHPFTL